MITEMLINQDKYENSILYLCQKLGGELRGKKKLAKLLYFADFDFYEKNNSPITGDIYKALPMGPFPTSLEDVVEKMAKNDKITISHIEREGYNPTEVYHCQTEVKNSSLTAEETQMLDRVILKYGHLSGTQLQELSHAEAPYIGTKLQGEIPYELAFYRGTDFSDLVEI